METTEITTQDIRDAVAQLSNSEKGRSTLRAIEHWFEQESGLGLDYRNQQAVMTILAGAWGSKTGTVRELVSDAIVRRPPPSGESLRSAVEHSRRANSG